jgi:hypothetical protein
MSERAWNNECECCKAMVRERYNWVKSDGSTVRVCYLCMNWNAECKHCGGPELDFEPCACVTGPQIKFL